jgi:hypothetical protein
MKQAIEIALRTWYPKDHPLHFNRHHPLGKLLGEWGELLDDYMKSLYKPGYVFEPENELGDIWYYLRILCYQKQECCEYEIHNYDHCSEKTGTDWIISNIMVSTSTEFNDLVGEQLLNIPSVYLINCNFTALSEICNRYDLNLDQLTASNWEKLKPGSERGNEWMKTRMSANG